MKTIKILVAIKGGAGHVILTRHGEKDITISQSGEYGMKYPVFGKVMVYAAPPHEGSIEIAFFAGEQPLAKDEFNKPDSRSYTLIIPEL